MPLVRLETQVCAIKEKFFNDLFVGIEIVRLGSNAHNCKVERSLSSHILRINICSQGYQKLHIHELALKDGEVKRRGLVAVTRGHVKGVFFAQDQDRYITSVCLSRPVHHTQFVCFSARFEPGAKVFQYEID